MSTEKFYTDNQGRKRPITPMLGNTGPRKYKPPVAPEKVEITAEVIVEETEEDPKTTPAKPGIVKA